MPTTAVKAHKRNRKHAGRRAGPHLIDGAESVKYNIDASLMCCRPSSTAQHVGFVGCVGTAEGPVMASKNTFIYDESFILQVRCTNFELH